MDVWQLAILGFAAFLAVRSLVNMAVAHEHRYRRRRKRELKRERRRARWVVARERGEKASEAAPNNPPSRVPQPVAGE